MMDNLEVRKRLPHREPFLFIDEVLEVNDEFIKAKRSFNKQIAKAFTYHKLYPIRTQVNE